MKKIINLNVAQCARSIRFDVSQELCTFPYDSFFVSFIMKENVSFSFSDGKITMETIYVFPLVNEICQQHIGVYYVVDNNRAFYFNDGDTEVTEHEYEKVNEIRRKLQIPRIVR